MDANSIYYPNAEGAISVSDIDNSTTAPNVVRKRDERRAFVFLALFLAPILAVAIVGGYGFLIWMTQIIAGPPTG